MSRSPGATDFRSSGARRRLDSALSAVTLVLASGCGRTPAPRPPLPEPPPPIFLPVTHGVAAGDVTDRRAVIWSRTDRYAAMHVRAKGGGQSLHVTAWVTEAHDFSGKLTLNALSPGTDYEYSVWFSSDERDAAPGDAALSGGHFRTAPPSGADLPITFGWSGDLGGLNACRDVKEGYPVFRPMDGRRLDFFVGLGDMIYGDQGCTAHGFYGNAQIPTPVAESATLRAYWAHWKYNREDDGLRRLLASTAYFGVWDDHEVVNDFSPDDDWHRFPPYTIGASLLPLGRRALLDYSPIFEDPSAPDRLYQSYRWGRHLELIVLDTRSYRDPNPAPDLPGHPKTMLGAAQRSWFEGVVTRSNATWKVVVSSVPISIPTGRGGTAGHDGWANYDIDAGYERELEAMWRTFRDRGVKNLVWITTDVHFATGFAYHPFPETPSFIVYEFSAGPLGAMLLPTHAVDESFHPERLFFFGSPEQPHSFEEATHFMNWGRIAIDRSGDLTASIIDGLGAEVIRHPLPMARASAGPTRAREDRGTAP